MNGEPLVTVGIPTFNRVGTLMRAVTSVLQQVYPAIEIVISDNASEDGTESYCRSLAGSKVNIRYFRQSVNIGPAENFRETLRHANGVYFMWLADDDWVDADYIGQCVSVLQAHSDGILANALTKYFDGDILIAEERPLILDQETGSARLLSYYEQVERNGVFLGVFRRCRLTRIPLIDCIGGDWLLMAAIAFSGKFYGVESSVNRSDNGVSNNWRSLVIGMGGSKWLLLHRKMYFFSIMYSVYRDIVFGNPIYRSLPFLRRLELSLRASMRIRRHYKIWASKIFLDILRAHVVKVFVAYVSVIRREIGARTSLAKQWRQRRSKVYKQ